MIVVLRGLKLFFFLMLSDTCPYCIESFVLSLRRIYRGYLAHAALHVFLLRSFNSHFEGKIVLVLGKGKRATPCWCSRANVLKGMDSYDNFKL